MKTTRERIDGVEWRKGGGKVKKEREAGNKEKVIKYWIVHEICEPNLGWNYDNSQNREIIASLLECFFF